MTDKNLDVSINSSNTGEFFWSYKCECLDKLTENSTMASLGIISS